MRGRRDFWRCVMATIDSNLIENNQCAGTGGIVGGGLDLFTCSGSAITNNVFAYNQVINGQEIPLGGGAIYATQSSAYLDAANPLAIVNNTFVSNQCVYDSSGTIVSSNGCGGAIQIACNPYHPPSSRTTSSTLMWRISAPVWRLPIWQRGA